MTNYILLGKYSKDSVKTISKERTQEAIKIVEQFGGFNSIYVTLGCFDVVIIAHFNAPQDAMKASIALSKMSGISFTTLPAVPVEEFDKMVEQL